MPARKYFEPAKYPRRKIGTHEIPKRKYFGPTKYPREKIHEIPTKKYIGPSKYPWRHNGTMTLSPTRLTMARDPQNLAHSFSEIEIVLWFNYKYGIRYSEWHSSSVRKHFENSLDLLDYEAVVNASTDSYQLSEVFSKCQM